jgi:hypothetical protein
MREDLGLGCRDVSVRSGGAWSIARMGLDPSRVVTGCDSNRFIAKPRQDSIEEVNVGRTGQE